jgi:hypothetical protein
MGSDMLVVLVKFLTSCSLELPCSSSGSQVQTLALYSVHLEAMNFILISNSVACPFRISEPILWALSLFFDLGLSRGGG